MQDNYERVPLTTKVCQNCNKFDERTHFCRAEPPKIVVFIEEDGSNKVSSKFPVITKPTMDWCEKYFKNKNLPEEE